MATQDEYIRTALRVPPELHKQIHRAAFIANRTFNAEILSRLQASFDGAASALPLAIQDAVTQEQEKRGGTPDDALTRLVQVAQAQGGTVFNLTVPADMKMGQLLELLQASKTVIPADASITVTRATPPPTA